jgi:hypothetical protein
MIRISHRLRDAECGIGEHSPFGRFGCVPASVVPGSRDLRPPADRGFVCDGFSEASGGHAVPSFGLSEFGIVWVAMVWGWSRTYLMGVRLLFIVFGVAVGLVERVGSFGPRAGCALGPLRAVSLAWARVSSGALVCEFVGLWSLGKLLAGSLFGLWPCGGFQGWAASRSPDRSPLGPLRGPASLSFLFLCLRCFQCLRWLHAFFHSRVAVLTVANMFPMLTWHSSAI